MAAACIIREARAGNMDHLVELVGLPFRVEADFAVDAGGRGLGTTRPQLLTDKDNAAAFAFYASCGNSTTNLARLRCTLP